MSGECQIFNNRGISPILGTVLVFSFVVLIAFSLVMVGFNVFEDATEDTEERVGQDTVVEWGDRVESITDSSVESATTLSVPRGVGEDLRADSETGVLRLEVTTADSNLSANDIVANNLSETREFKLGTVTHRKDDGPLTVYQGGMVFERQGSSVRILSEPNFDYSDNGENENIEFSFTDLSDIDSLSEGNELYAERNIEASRARIEEINRILAEHRVIGDDIDNPIGYAPVTVTLTIETEYPEVWETYAEKRMTTEPGYTTTDSSISFSFTRLGGNSTLGTTFAKNILYTGDQRATHLYYNDTVGAVGNIDNGFNISGIGGASSTQIHKDKYGLAVADDGSWKIAEYDTGPSPNLKWFDVNGTRVSAPAQFNSSESNIGPGGGPGGASNDDWVWDGDPIICAVVNDGTGPGNVNTGDTREAVAEGDCNQGVITSDQSDIPDQEPRFELDSVTSNPAANLQVKDDLTVSYTVKNTGNAYDEQYIYLAADLDSDGEFELADYKQYSLYPGRDASETQSFEVPASFNDNKPVRLISASASDVSLTGFTLTGQPDFAVDSISTDSVATAGEVYNVDAEIRNDGAQDTQVVTLADPDGNVIDAQQLNLSNSQSATARLSWDVPLDADLGSGVDLTVATQDNDQTVAVNPEPKALIRDVDVDKTVISEQTRRQTSRGLYFPGSGDYLDTGKKPSDLGVDGTSPKTVSVWAYTEQFDDGGLFEMGTEENGRDFALRTLSSTNEWRGQFWSRGADIDFTYDSQDKWTHFVVTWDGSETRIYANGTEVASDGNSLNTGNSKTFKIGRWQNSDFSGAIEDVRLYNRSLSESEIQNLSSRTAVNGGLVGYWPMDTIQSGTVEDDTGNGNDATVVGSVSDGYVYSKTLDLNVEAEIEPVGGTVDQDVELTGLDGTQADSVSIDTASTTTVDLSYTASEAITGELTVSTEDDEQDQIVVVERDGPLCSDVDYSGSEPYSVSNVDELQCIETHDLDADYELTDDIHAQGTEYWNDGAGFEPIGDQFREGDGGDHYFGNFDGQGYAIEGLTIDRPDDAFVGIFGITGDFGDTGTGDGALMENIVLEDIDVYGETVVGGLAGGGGGTFKRISVDGHIESQYQQVGGIVGHAHDGDLTNELVSTATVEGNYPIVVDPDDSHPWQTGTDSPNLGIGGILGGMGFETKFSTGYSRANVSGPSSVGGITGWTSNEPSDLKQMYWADGTLELEGDRRVFETDRTQFTDPLQTGGIAGRIGETSGSEDEIFNSVYSDGPTVGDGGDNVEDNSIALSASEMKGPQVLPDPDSDHDFSQYDGVDNAQEFFDRYPGIDKDDAEGTMANLDWDIWTPVYDVDENGTIVNEGLPKFNWQVDGQFLVTITDLNSSLKPGTEDMVVDVNVENTADVDQKQTLTLTNHDGTVVDSQRVDLNSGEETDITLTWETTFRDEVTSKIDPAEIIVSSEDTRDTENTVLQPVDGNTITIENVDTNETVRALNQQLNVSVDVNATKSNGLGGETLALRANGNLVAIDDGLSGDFYSTTLTWTPRTADVGAADLSIQILDSDVSKSAEVQVLRPLRSTLGDDDLPIDVDFDLISVG